jgi:hypothetical protein
MSNLLVTFWRWLTLSPRHPVTPSPPDLDPKPEIAPPGAGRVQRLRINLRVGGQWFFYVFDSTQLRELVAVLQRQVDDPRLSLTPAAATAVFSAAHGLVAGFQWGMIIAGGNLLLAEWSGNEGHESAKARKEEK